MGQPIASSVEYPPEYDVKLYHIVQRRDDRQAVNLQIQEGPESTKLTRYSRGFQLRWQDAMTFDIVRDRPVESWTTGDASILQLLLPSPLEIWIHFQTGQDATWYVAVPGDSDDTAVFENASIDANNVTQIATRLLNITEMQFNVLVLRNLASVNAAAWACRQITRENVPQFLAGYQRFLREVASVISKEQNTNHAMLSWRPLAAPVRRSSRYGGMSTFVQR